MFCYILFFLKVMILQKSSELELHFKSPSATEQVTGGSEQYMKFNEFYYFSSILSIIFL